MSNYNRNLTDLSGICKKGTVQAQMVALRDGNQCHRMRKPFGCASSAVVPCQVKKLAGVLEPGES